MTTTTKPKTPLADVYVRAHQTAAELELLWQDCECAVCVALVAAVAAGLTTVNAADAYEACTACKAMVAADEACDRARAAWSSSDEPRQWAFGGDSLAGGYERGHWHRPSEVEEALRTWTSGGSWKHESTIWIHDGARPIDPATGEPEKCDEIQVTVTLQPSAPKCRQGHTHTWCSPHSVLGGLEDNPGVFGHGGGGLLIREVCGHCGAYRVTDTWAQDGAREGLTSIGYEPADDESLVWLDSRSES